MKSFIAGLAFLLLVSCETPPVKVTPPVNVAAVKYQNTVTRTHITHTRQHLQKSQEVEAGVDVHLQKAKQAVDQLVNE